MKKLSKKNIITIAIVALVVIFVFSRMEIESSDDKTTETTQTEVTKETEEKKKQKTKEKTKETKSTKKKEPMYTDEEYNAVNAEMREHLLQSLGWALGELDENGEPTENGTPNPDFNWALFVDEISLDKDHDQINIYVTPEFSDLSEEDKQQVAKTAQNVSISYVKDNKRNFAVVYQNGKQIGMSRITDVSEFKFK